MRYWLKVENSGCLFRILVMLKALVAGARRTRRRRRERTAAAIGGCIVIVAVR